MFRQLHDRSTVIFLLLLIISCGPTRLSQQDMSSQLAAPDARLQPYFTIYQTADSTFLYGLVHTTELLYHIENDTAKALFSVYYELRPSFESALIHDSSTYYFPLLRDSVAGDFRFWFPIKKIPGVRPVLKLLVKDEFLKKESERILIPDFTANNLQQKFVLADTTGIPLVRTTVRPDETFTFISSIYGTASTLVRCYFRTFPHPAPPFSKKADPRFSFRPDSIFQYNVGNHLQLHREGIYHFQTDTSGKEGFTVFVFDPWFPEFKSPAQLIPPLRYLTMRNEYQEMLQKENPKEAAESFWLKTGGRNDRSKALIRIYYQRAQEANRRFTSYVPGWKTDRGMIYMILGPPASVYRSDNLEQWTYNTDNGTITLDFKQILNPFTDNDFSLVRREEYEYPWYQWVDKWRKGNISLRH